MKFKLFIYDEINIDEITRYKEFWKQIYTDNWIEITDELYCIIDEIGWIDDLRYLNYDTYKEDFMYKKLNLTEKQKIGIFRLDEEVINYFDRFDNEMKIKYKYPFQKNMYIDYNNGEVFIFKNKFEKNDNKI